MYMKSDSIEKRIWYALGTNRRFCASKFG